MLRLTIVLASLAACHALPRPLEENSKLKIVGGLTADIKDFPFQVSLRRDDVIYCGGSILSEHWILTAGHCVYDLHGDLASVKIRVGSTSQSSGGQEVGLAWAATHPQFNIRTYVYDVGLLKVDTPLVLNKVSARPTRLVAAGKSLTPGQLLTISGWGRLAINNPDAPDHLLAVMLPNLPLEVCKGLYATRNLLVDDTMICAGFGGKDSCKGDSGGPVVDDQQVQVGIVSWGVGCGDVGYPGLYSNLANPILRQWIVQTVEAPQS
ncbi:trypsin-like [Thrips palmi]|uniref:Trypsin-like n=1 Tax=Thrips palmi TaxID=161013 RepID=A0A6P9AD95_THRPL|nr:trypsin-like [Thrips palmi]